MTDPLESKTNILPTSFYISHLGTSLKEKHNPQKKKRSMHGTHDKLYGTKKNLSFRRSFPWVVAWVLSYGTMVDVNVALC